ncbi:MAG: hypothetical protein M1813_000905 [Trichoglossum hirsutum]|nr:MAG: hypothetical protein M1813_000905 [Trichoglossum hirsutum]
MEEDRSYNESGRGGRGGDRFGGGAGGSRSSNFETGQRQYWGRGARDTQTSRAQSSINWRGNGQQQSIDNKPQRPQASTPAASSGEGDSSASQAMAEGRRLYLGNMPYMAKTEDIEALLTDNGYKAERIDISIDPFTGRNPSYCFVELETKEQADEALLELNGKELLGRPLKVGPGVAKSGGRSSARGGRSSGHHHQEGNRSFVFDRWERTDASDHWYGYSDQGRRLYVGGLPRMPDQRTVDNEIRNFFQGFNIDAISKIISPHISKRAQPGNHYYLFVDFPSADEAAAAARALNGKSPAWGGRLVVTRARGNSRRVEERNLWEDEQDGGEE